MGCSNAPMHHLINSRFNLHHALYSENGHFPNNGFLPFLLYKNVLLFPAEKPEVMRALEANGWSNSWTGSIFDYHHYHSTAHELLVVLSGNAVVQIGGPLSDVFEVGVGDALLLPGGLAHKCETASGNFMVLAAYPNQQRYDIKKGKAEEKEKAMTNILKLALPQNDPFFGNDGPVKSLWKMIAYDGD